MGGANNGGTVFKVGTNHTITTLASFGRRPGGAWPIGATVRDSSGNLFGATEGGGANGDGVLFEVVSGSGSITPLVSFGTTIDSTSSSIVIDSSDDIFGTSYDAGANDDGAIFELPAGSQTFQHAGFIQRYQRRLPRQAIS